LAVALVITVVLLRARTPLQVRTACREYEPQAWAGAVVPLLFVSGFAYANRELGLLLVGSLAGAEAAGIYRGAVRGSDLVVFALTGIIVAISPRLARLHAESNLKALRRRVRRGALASMLWAVPVAAVMIGTGRWLLTTVFGAAYSSGTTSLAILAAGQLINAATGPVGILLNMTGRERKTARGHAVALGVQLISGIVLIPRWGVEGAAAATALSVAARNLIFVFEGEERSPPSGNRIGNRSMNQARNVPRSADCTRFSLAADPLAGGCRRLARPVSTGVRPSGLETREFPGTKALISSEHVLNTARIAAVHDRAGIRRALSSQSTDRSARAPGLNSVLQRRIIP
jgi:hypothetical protein